jgi:DNA-binding PadR family transcriptional regulator
METKMRFNKHCHRSPLEGGGGSDHFRSHRRFGRERHGGGGRIFEQGDLRQVILKLIGEKPSHGYEIIKAIEDRLGGSYSPSPGVVYPTLTLLEETGLIAASQSDGPRKLYEITAEGRAALERDKATTEAIFARMGEVNARLGGGPAPQIIRAYENLKTALKLRLRRGPLSAAQIAAIAALLDETAKTVESL